MTRTEPRRLPVVVPDGRLPKRVTVYEVGPRDGLQNEQRSVPLEVKVELVERLVAAGLPVVEVTSLVSPRWVPQLADAEELLTRLARGPVAGAVPMPVLVPNDRPGTSPRCSTPSALPGSSTSGSRSTSTTPTARRWPTPTPPSSTG